MKANSLGSQIKFTDVSMLYPVDRNLKQVLLNPFKQVERRHALNSLTFKIEHGDCVAFLGPNGAGKTTLLKLVGGLLFPTHGKITVGGLDTVSENRKAKEKIGFVMNEERSFFWRLTGRQNLMFFGALDQLRGRRLRERVQYCLDRVGMKSAGDRRFSDYSSGMRQRLSIARGILTEPEILILDEPTRALDPLGTVDIWNIINSEFREKSKKTILIATHRMDEVENLCNKVCIIDKGHLKKYLDISGSAFDASVLFALYGASINQTEHA